MCIYIYVYIYIYIYIYLLTHTYTYTYAYTYTCTYTYAYTYTYTYAFKGCRPCRRPLGPGTWGLRWGYPVAWKNRVYLGTSLRRAFSAMLTIKKQHNIFIVGRQDDEPKFT